MEKEVVETRSHDKLARGMRMVEGIRSDVGAP